jgi:hypothetical protein
MLKLKPTFHIYWGANPYVLAPIRMGSGHVARRQHLRVGPLYLRPQLYE